MNEILVVVDCQNDFIDGTLGTKEAVAVVPNIVEKIKTFKTDKHKIFVTLDTHDNYYLDSHEGKKLPIKHCVKHTSGWALNQSIYEAVVDDDRYFCPIEKHSFGSMTLCNKIMEYIGREYCLTDFRIHVIGLCTDICVITNALLLRTKFPYADIIVDSSCCAGTTPEMHEAALNVMRSCQIDVI